MPVQVARAGPRWRRSMWTLRLKRWRARAALPSTSTGPGPELGRRSGLPKTTGFRHRLKIFSAPGRPRARHRPGFTAGGDAVGGGVHYGQGRFRLEPDGLLPGRWHRGRSDWFLSAALDLVLDGKSSAPRRRHPLGDIKVFLPPAPRRARRTGSGPAVSANPLKAWLEKDGTLLRLRLARPKSNIVDAAMIAALRSALDEHLPSARLKAVLLDAEGPHFSFGASVEEHLPETCARMLRDLHTLILQILGSPVPVLSAVRGQCLGGGLRSYPGAPFRGTKLGQPVQLAVFAPAASACCRADRRAAEDLFPDATWDLGMN